MEGHVEVELVVAKRNDGVNAGVVGDGGAVDLVAEQQPFEGGRARIKFEDADGGLAARPVLRRHGAKALTHALHASGHGFAHHLGAGAPQAALDHRSTLVHTDDAKFDARQSAHPECGSERLGSISP